MAKYKWRGKCQKDTEQEIKNIRKEKENVQVW